MSDLMSQSYHDVMEVYKRPMSVRYIPAFLWGFICIVSLSLAFPQITQAYEAEPVIWVQVPQWTDDWAVCAVDIPDAACHWYVANADNTFGEGFDLSLIHISEPTRRSMSSHRSFTCSEYSDIR